MERTVADVSAHPFIRFSYKCFSNVKYQLALIRGLEVQIEGTLWVSK